MKKHHVISGIYHSTEAPETRGWGVGGRTATNRGQEPDATCVVWSMSSCRSMSAQGSEPHRQAKGRTYWKEKVRAIQCFSKLYWFPLVDLGSPELLHAALLSPLLPLGATQMAVSCPPG